MTGWHFLDEDDFDELLRLSRQYHREALRCQESKAYLAGCTMAGAALEALLLAMLHLYGDEVQTAGHGIMAKGKPKALLDWKLAEMLQVAAAMGWLPAALKVGSAWNTRKARIGDYAQALRQIRNLVHPARYIQDHSPSRVTRKYLTRSLEILDLAVTHLEAKVHASLRKQMELGI